MEDILLTEKDLLNIITSVHVVKTMSGLSEQDRKEYDELLNKIKVLYASSLLSDSSSMLMADQENDQEQEHDEFEDEEYIFKNVSALVTENHLFDEGSETKKVKVNFSLVKVDNSFLALVDTEKESLETTIKSFKLEKNLLHLFEKTKDKEPLFTIEILEEGETKNE